MLNEDTSEGVVEEGTSSRNELSEIKKEEEDEEKKPLSSDLDSDKSILKSKLRSILSCTICLELRRCAMYQCKRGHLICAGCFGDILSESRLQNEIASCPKCLTTISKELCSRNVAVEKTISELPVSCYHCLQAIPPEEYDEHKKLSCEKRPEECPHSMIGCNWKGPHVEATEHNKICIQPTYSGKEILQLLTQMDGVAEADNQLYQKIFDVLSEKKFNYYDLQFKRSNFDRKNHPTDNVIYETSKFSAFESLWFIHAHYKETTNFFGYKLVSRSMLLTSKSLHFLIVKGPYSELNIKPKLGYYKFTEKLKESPLDTLTFLCNPDTLRKFFSSQRINFRLFLFDSNM